MNVGCFERTVLYYFITSSVQINVDLLILMDICAIYINSFFSFSFLFKMWYWHSDLIAYCLEPWLGAYCLMCYKFWDFWDCSVSLSEWALHLPKIKNFYCLCHLYQNFKCLVYKINLSLPIFFSFAFYISSSEA